MRARLANYWFMNGRKVSGSNKPDRVVDSSLGLEGLMVDSSAALLPGAFLVMVADSMVSCYLQMVAQLDVERPTAPKRLEDQLLAGLVADCDCVAMDPLKLAVTVAGARKVSGLAAGCQEVVGSRDRGILGMPRSTEDQRF